VEDFARRAALVKLLKKNGRLPAEGGAATAATAFPREINDHIKGCIVMQDGGAAGIEPGS
jgi:hypothetical protein